jgi:DNA topoisomerase-1
LTKFDRLTAFAQALPGIRERVSRDLSRAPFSRDNVLAFVVSLLEQTLVRIGNTEYMRQNNSYGLTTLRDYHVRISGSILTLKFRGKRGKLQEIDMCDRRLARLAKKYQELPGQELLKYQDGPGTFKVIESGDVNQYLKEIAGEDFTAKDFRTWGATVFAANDLYRLGPAASEQERKRKISQSIKATASKLGNTPAVCRKYYIDPKIIEAYSNNRLFEVMYKIDSGDGGNGFALNPEEAAVLDLLKDSKNGPLTLPSPVATAVTPVLPGKR